MEAKETVMIPEQTKAKRKELFPHGHKDCFECEEFIRQAQAEITWDIAFKAGVEKGHDQCAHCDTPLLHEGEVYEANKAGYEEVMEWLREYAIHGGKEPLNTVLDDLRIHSPYGKPKVKEWLKEEPMDKSESTLCKKCPNCDRLFPIEKDMCPNCWLIVPDTDLGSIVRLGE